jgi:hypothetical protein
MAHTVAHDDDARLGDFNLDADHVRWFDQPPADEDRGRRREHGHEVIRVFALIAADLSAGP